MLGLVGIVEHPSGIAIIAKVSHQEMLAEGNEKANSSD